MNYRVGQLILTPASKNNTISEVFVAQPDHEKEMLAGKIFVLLEIESKRSDGLKLANFLINYINNSYYQNEKLILKEKIPSLRVEHIFESVVSRANKKILEFIKEENIKISSSSLNSTIGLIYNNEIHFSTAGKNRAILVYKKTQNGEKIYKTIDLNKDEDKDDSKTKLFTNVISGSIPDGSIFLFSNEALPEYLSSKQLSEIVTTLPPTSAVEQIKNTLTQINEYISFVAIVIKSSRLDNEREKLPTPPQVDESVNKLNDTEQSTEDILSPSGNIKIKSYFNSLNNILSKILPKKESNNTLFLKTSSKLNSRALKFYLKKILIIIQSLLINIANFLFYIFKTLSNGKKLREIFAQFKKTLTGLFYFIKNNKQKIKNKYKIIVILFLFSIVGFSYELHKIKLQKIAELNKEKYEEIKKSIEQKENQAEASLLYNNEDNAKTLFIEIKKLLSEYPQETEYQKNEYTEFSKKLSEQLDKVRKIVDISNDNLVLDFSEVNKNSKVNEIILNANNIYASDPDQNSIYIVDLNSKETTTITDLNDKLNKIKYPILNDDTHLYWFNNDSIVKLNTDTEEIFSIDLSRKAESNIVAMSTYNGRTYMLDNGSSQIYRYEKGDNGFSSYSRWLNKKEDLSNGVSMDIDGYIYVLDKDGTIHRFLKGAISDFNQDIIEPPLQSAQKIFVSKEKDFIYVLDSNNSRIVIFDKDGRFIEQQKSKDLQDIKDFTVDEKNKLIYILANNKIFFIPIDHLE